MTSPALDVQKLTAGYDGADVIRDVTFSIARREVLGLMGANGTGKSTILRCIAGLLTPRGGTIDVCGQRLTAAEPREIRKRGVIYLPQTLATFPRFSVAKNLQLAGLLIPQRSVLKRRIYAACERMDLSRSMLRRLAGELSGGEARIVALAMLLVPYGNVYLLDEPTSSLSEAAIERFLAVASYIAQSGGAVLIVDHNRDVLNMVADALCTVDVERSGLQCSPLNNTDTRRMR